MKMRTSQGLRLGVLPGERKQKKETQQEQPLRLEKSLATGEFCKLKEDRDLRRRWLSTKSHSSDSSGKVKTWDLCMWIYQHGCHWQPGQSILMVQWGQLLDWNKFKKKMRSNKIENVTIKTVSFAEKWYNYWSIFFKDWRNHRILVYL